MPCRYYSPEEERDIADKKLVSTTRRMNKYKRDLDKVTRLLCKIMGEISGDGYTFDEEATKWWEHHQKMDILREKKEKK
jgi:hypothetical protein